MTIDFNNKEERLAYFAEWRNKNRGSILAYKRAWNHENKPYVAQHAKKYRQTPKGKKNCLIHNWKRIGIIVDDYDSLYERYKNTKYCDNFRNILCTYCNLMRG